MGCKKYPVRLVFTLSYTSFYVNIYIHIYVFTRWFYPKRLKRDYFWSNVAVVRSQLIFYLHMRFPISFHIFTFYIIHGTIYSITEVQKFVVGKIL